MSHNNSNALRAKTTEADQQTISGNILFFILIAIFLIGAVTAAIRSGSQNNSNIDKETILINASAIQQYASDLERAVSFIIQSGESETDISFAHPDAPTDYGTIGSSPSTEVFHPDGGGADYQEAPDGINNGDGWEFYGNTHLPEVGTDTRAELIAVLPNVIEGMCDQINKSIGYDTATQPSDSGTCLKSSDGLRFTSSQKFTTGGSINTVDDGTMTVKPSTSGCVECGAGSGNFHFFRVLLSR
jgi:hypothetical protein